MLVLIVPRAFLVSPIPLNVCVAVYVVAVSGVTAYAHEAVDPLVVTNFPEFPVCAGRADENAVLATNAVVAICVELVPTEAVGADGIPVNVGDAIGALVDTEFRSDAVAVTAVIPRFGNCVANAVLMPRMWSSP